MTDKWTDKQMFDFLNGFRKKTKAEKQAEITDKYIRGLINKDEFFKQMKEVNNG